MKKIILVSFVIIFFITSCSKSYDMGDDYYEPQISGEQYNEITENPFVDVSQNPISTFSIDVDGGSYTNARRFINAGELPPADAIRTEEFVNYFSYEYAEPSDSHPFYIDGEIAQCPWENTHQILRIGLKGKNIIKENLPATNFVFLIDVSGSMQSEDKLELLKNCFILFVDELRSSDRVAIVTYAGADEIILESTTCDNKDKIINAIENLDAGGGTAGAEGIITAYEIAQQNFIKGGNNRVILGTDGDFNIGTSSQDELISLIEEKRETGIFITTLGVGTGNLNEGMLEQIANHGNGNFEYIDNLEQGKKVFIYNFNSFYAIAKDVKLQITFNPEAIKQYRLIGYENRMLNDSDFTDDSKDAGELGSNQTICALYELIPNNSKALNAFTMQANYKLPESQESITFSFDLDNEYSTFENASENLRFATAAAGFGLLLRKSEYIKNVDYDDIINWAETSKTYNPHYYKEGFIELVKKAKNL